MNTHHKSQRLGTEAILPLLFRLSIPGMVSMSVQALYNVVDSLFVARVSENALTALAIAFPVHIFIIALSTGTGIGTSALISRMLGKDNRQGAFLVAQHVITAGLVYGVLSGLAGIFLSESIVSIFTNDPEVLVQGTQYVRILLLGSVFLYVSIIASDIMRGQGNTFVPMLALMIGAITNIVLDPFMIFGIGIFPRLEVLGAALATVISKAISCLFILVILYGGNNEIKPRLEGFSFDFRILAEVYKIGLPNMVMQVMTSFMIGILNSIVGAYSEVAIAVNGVYFRLQSFAIMPVFGLTQAYIPIIGYNYGAGNTERMKKTVLYALMAGFLITGAGSLLFRFFPVQLMSLFNPGEEMLEIGVHTLQTISIGLFVVGPAIVGATTFQAIGKGLPALALSFLRQMILLIPLAYLFGHLWGLYAVWYAFPASEFIAFVIMILWLGNKLKKVFKEMEAQQAAPL
ncbi:putative efflux protein, MATE family [Tindallia magadiensis]|uniref:Putative efflux protein, MATE family n=1 Tax=Tindallia magadiensis TaxID=69895 RepID=A0A1I3BF10_9FIRM|nr:MATE family efflux transporter [Tindallia magadiensis]SFH60311.1 putative efflux protein, MATE family [Tindallia magadiensis]